VRQFVDVAARELGMTLSWEGEGVDEVGVIAALRGDYAGDASIGQTAVRIDPRYLRPTEVDTLLGDPTKAHRKLGWRPRIRFNELVAEMVQEDYRIAQRDCLVKDHGFPVLEYHE
jgi:GDPmannose 4,6-dehydratase